MTESDSYTEWLHQLSLLSWEATLALPKWQQPAAIIQQFAVNHLYDGAGSLFYNSPDKILPTAASLEAIDETELSRLVLRIFEILSPIFDTSPSDLQAALVKQIDDGPAASLAKELDDLIEQRWENIHDKIRNLAEANGWS